ncbi:MAG: hypothetical protein JW940_35015 [Polyangiaceae bacterium]|nr:hypothetical protein [Polyangiaceae bacterium]
MAIDHRPMCKELGLDPEARGALLCVLVGRCAGAGLATTMHRLARLHAPRRDGSEGVER